MKKATGKTEFVLWQNADLRQKSYLVRVLHWFHYRPQRLRGSWKQEEVLTWELLRALEILPERLFARPLLERIAELGPSTQRPSRYLLDSPRLEITAYPSLELRGGKRNCRSDIGFGVPGSKPTVWIEAKTASFNAVTLEKQLEQQVKAMRSLLGDTPFVLLTLLAEPRALAGYPNISWTSVVKALESCVQRLPHAIQDEELFRGFQRIACELIDRVESHPNRPKGWV